MKKKPMGIVTEGTLIRAKRNTPKVIAGTAGIVTALSPSAPDRERFINIQWNYKSATKQAEWFTRPGAIEFLEVIED